MDDRLAIGRALEECPGDMVELRAGLLAEPQPAWRQQPSNDLPVHGASRLNVLEALQYE